MKLTYIKLSVTQILFILLLALSNNVFAQNKEIKVTGTIYDETGITLPSVTVTVKGQKGVGVLSDNDGKFMITVPEGSTLIFSFVGMKSQEVVVNAKQVPYKITWQRNGSYFFGFLSKSARFRSKRISRLSKRVGRTLIFTVWTSSGRLSASEQRESLR